MSIKVSGADHLLLGKVKLFYYFLSESCWEVTYLLTFFSSHVIFNILFKGFKKFRNLFWFHDRENEIWNEGVILLVVALIFSLTVFGIKDDFMHYKMYIKTSFYSVHSQSIYNAWISLVINSARSQSIFIERQ